MPCHRPRSRARLPHLRSGSCPRRRKAHETLIAGARLTTRCSGLASLAAELGIVRPARVVRAGRTPSSAVGPAEQVAEAGPNDPPRGILPLAGGLARC